MIQGHEITIKKLLGPDYVFDIPGYQRPYSWTAEEAQEVDFPRLDEVPATKIDLHSIALTGYDIAEREPTSEGEYEEPPTPNSVNEGDGGSRPGALPVHMQELIVRLNRLFGEATPWELGREGPDQQEQ